MSDILPTRLKVDAIVEATMEVRFEPEASPLPEILYGKLASVDEWKSYKQVRLPTADIPHQARLLDAKLRGVAPV